MSHPPLLIKRRHRLCPRHLAPARMHGLERHRRINLAHDIDVVLMRQDPPFHLGYISAALLLDRLKGTTLVANDPREVVNAPEKMFVLDYARFMPPTLVARHLDDLRDFQRRHGSVVVKPLHGNGGKAIFRIDENGTNLSALSEVFDQTWPEMPEEMPWAHRIELIPPVGAPQVEVDNTQLIDMLLGQLAKLTPDGRHAALVKIALMPKSAAILSTLKQNADMLRKDKHLDQALTVALAKHGASSSPVTQKSRPHPLSASAKRGAEVYNTATCIACHQAHGNGLEKTFPPLNKSKWLSRNHTDAIRIVLKGMTGPVKVLGKDYNGGMPAQESLTDQQIADVLNFARNSWDNKLGDITVAEVTRVRAELKNRKLPFTAKDFEKPAPPKPLHHYNFSEGMQDTLGDAHAQVSGNKQPAKTSADGLDFSTTGGERCTSIKKDHYIDLPNNLISNATKEGVIGELSIETWLQVSENRPWAWAWGFGSSDQGENKSSGAAKSDYLALIPMNARSKKLRLCARGGGKEYYFDAKAMLEPGKMHHVVATFTRDSMALYLNGELAGRHPLPEKLDLTRFKNDNNWLGRSMFNDPVFEGIYQSLTIYPIALDAETILARAKR